MDSTLTSVANLAFTLYDFVLLTYNNLFRRGLILCPNTTYYKATIPVSRTNSHKMSSIFQSQSHQRMREIRTTRVIDQIALDGGNCFIFFFSLEGKLHSVSL